MDKRRQHSPIHTETELSNADVSWLAHATGLELLFSAILRNQWFAPPGLAPQSCAIPSALEGTELSQPAVHTRHSSVFAFVLGCDDTKISLFAHLHIAGLVNRSSIAADALRSWKTTHALTVENTTIRDATAFHSGYVQDI